MSLKKCIKIETLVSKSTEVINTFVLEFLDKCWFNHSGKIKGKDIEFQCRTYYKLSKTGPILRGTESMIILNFFQNVEIIVMKGVTMDLRYVGSDIQKMQRKIEIKILICQTLKIMKLFKKCLV